MSIKRKFEEKTYTKTEEVMVSEKRYCDICDREITGHHWHMITGHDDWDYMMEAEHVDISFSCPDFNSSVVFR